MLNKLKNITYEKFNTLFIKKITEEIAKTLTKKFATNKNKSPIFFPVGPKKIPIIFIHNTYGQRVFLDPADYFMTTHYIEHLDWEDHLDIVYKESLCNGGAYIDIGANIGLHVLRAHRCGASNIFAFEPNPNTHDILQLNLNINGIKGNCFCNALGEKNGIVGFNVTDYPAGMAKIELEGEHLLEVPIKTLNSFAEEHFRFEKLSLIKIDVEGYEGEVIKGAIDFLKQHSNFNIIIEFNSMSAVQAVQLLDEHFSFTMKLFRWGKSPINVDMNHINDDTKRLSGDLVLFGLQRKNIDE